jgi:hypothetical protein
VTIDLIVHKMTFLMGGPGMDYIFRNDVGADALLNFEVAVNRTAFHIFGVNMYFANKQWDGIVMQYVSKYFNSSSALGVHQRNIVEAARLAIREWVTATEETKEGGIDMFPAASRLVVRVAMRAFCGGKFVERYGKELFDL